MNLSRYQTLIFDCDGVVLNSNKVKSDAFHWAASPYGEKAASDLVAHHIAHGGVSRYKKFAHFIEHIKPDEVDGPGLDELLERYAAAVRQGLLECEAAPGLEALREATPHARWLIVSGGDQQELRSVFAERDILKFFDGGVFGSPDNKETILSREMGAGNITSPALFLGDSRYDYTAASGAGADFLFVSGWTEIHDWPAFVAEIGAPQITYLSHLLT